jgi:hypothetical protein
MSNKRGEVKGEKRIDIGIGWVVRYEHSDTWLDFRAYEAVGENGNNGEADDGALLFMLAGKRSEHDWTTDVEKAEPTITGFVKWDGCSEMHFDRTHFCGRRDVVDFAAVLVAIHDLARDTLPKFDREVGR